MAAETRELNILTTLNVVGTNIFIKSEYYNAVLPNTILALLADAVGSLDGTSYIEGELVIQMTDYPTAIDYNMNKVGNLIVGSATGDSDGYSINSNGELEWYGDDGL